MLGISFHVAILPTFTNPSNVSYLTFTAANVKRGPVVTFVFVFGFGGQRMSVGILLGAGTFYDVLGVAPDASTSDVRRAFKALALALHPDKLGSRAQHPQASSSDAFVRVRAAYAVLSDPVQRAHYDATTLARAVRRSVGAVSDRRALSEFNIAEDGADGDVEAVLECRCGGEYFVSVPPLPPVSEVASAERVLCHVECDSCSLVIAVVDDRPRCASSREEKVGNP